jgi:hypothetical protein
MKSRKFSIAVLIVAMTITAACTTHKVPEHPPGLEALYPPEIEYPASAVAPGASPHTADHPRPLHGHGYSLVADGKPLRGDVHVSGTVKNVAVNKITFQSGNGNTIMTYELPGKKQLQIDKGEKLTIHILTGKTLQARNYTLIDSCNGRLLHAAAHIIAPDAITSAVAPSILLRQVAGGGTATSDYDIVRHTPVILENNGKKNSLSTDKPTLVTIDGQQYKILILKSIEAHPTGKGKGVSETEGFELEYVLVRI